jgi:predicted nucleic acid-binding protein
MGSVPDRQVSAWLDQQPATSIWTTSVTIFEIEVGLQSMATGKKKAVLTLEFQRLLDEIEHRIAAFDEEAARIAANLTTLRQQHGRVIDLRDTMIAGIVLARHAGLATRNVSHFSDISAPVMNPWAG